MAARIHRRLKFFAFKANGFCRHRYELSKQLQGLHIDLVLLSETHFKPHERCFIPYHFYRTDRLPERKDGTDVAVRKCIPHIM
jgi:hypothetical protein